MHQYIKPGIFVFLVVLAFVALFCFQGIKLGIAFMIIFFCLIMFPIMFE